MDRYEKVRLLGEGGSGRAWLARDRLRGGGKVALKELSEATRGRERAMRREFVTLSSLRHPGVAEVFELDADPDSGLPRFSLEYVEGTDFVSAVRREGARALLDLTAEALQALAFLHDFGLIHRDLKPANLLVRNRPRLGYRLVVLDFGLAMRGGPEPGEAAGFAGTLPYVAPELFGGAAADRRSDLYALGIVVYESVHGRPPYLPKPGSRDIAPFIEAVRQGRRARPALPPGLPEGIGAWIEDMIAVDAGARPASAAEALARLNAACGTDYRADTAAERRARLLSGAPVGRDAELEALWRELEKGDAPTVVWLTGGAGSGKSRLLRWVEGEAVARGFDVVALSEDLFGERSVRDEEAVEGLLAGLRQRAAQRPTLVLVDEVERAGPRIASLLERVAREPKAPPLRVVAGLRPAELGHPSLKKLFEDTGFVPSLRRVELAPLGLEGLRSFAERAAGHGLVSEPRLQWLLEASEGNPLVAESLLVEGAWERGHKALASRSIAESVATRLGALSGAARSWLESLCLLGEGSDGELVGRLAGLDASAVAEAAKEVATLGLATERGGRWYPESRAVVEQVRQSFLGVRSKELYRRAAHLSVEAGGEASDPWRLARLWAGAEDPEEASRCALRAAEMEEGAGRPGEAAERYGFALRQLDPGDPRRRGLRLKQGEALLLAGLYRAAARAFGSAVRLSRGRLERAEALLRQAEASVRARRLERARCAAEEARQIFREAGERRRAAEAQCTLATVLVMDTRFRDALEMLREVWDDIVGSGDRKSLAGALHVRAICESTLRIQDAERHFREAIELYESLDLPQLREKSVLGLAIWYERNNRQSEARTLLEQIPDDWRKGANVALWPYRSIELTRLWVDAGCFDIAIGHAREAALSAMYLGDPSTLLNARGGEAEVLILLGQPSRAVETLEAALGSGSDKVEPRILGSAWADLARAMIHMGRGRESVTRELLERAVRIGVERKYPRLVLVARIVELERHAVSSEGDEFEQAWVAYREAAGAFGSEPEPWMIPRAEIARATHLFRRKAFREASEAAELAAEAARAANDQAARASALALAVESYRRLGDERAEARALEEGRRCLQEAAGRISNEAIRMDFLNRPDFKPLRQPEAASSEQRLLALYDMIRAVNSETDPDALLDSILDLALEVVRAERGTILLSDGSGEGFSVRRSRGLEQETAKDAELYSRHIVSRAGKGEAILSVDAGTDERFSSFKSISLHGIRSLMCVPLRSRGRITGTVYVDSRREGRLFSSEDLRFLEAFADHAALALENARARARLEEENRRLLVLAGERVRLDTIVGRSEPMQRIFDLIEKVAASELPVLIQGESGTGKELVARAIHFHGPRRQKVFLAENCASIPETLLESELFGHVRGAFTGAERDRVGLFEQAHGGTLFLDEVGDMSAGMQARLLRVLEDREVRRVGGTRSIRVDVRVIAATNKDLETEVRRGRFREDLLYRLQVLTIKLPALRDRPGDIPLLVEHMLEKIAQERGRRPPRLRSEVLDLFERYPWPGNVRQLENTLHRLAVLAGEGPIDLRVIESDESLRRSLLGASPHVAEPLLSLERTEQEQIRRALSASGGNRERAARLLGISRATIYRKIKEYGLG